MVQVLAPRAGPTGLIANLMKWGMQIVDVVSTAGAISKYTIGAAWTGAEFGTIQSAFNQAAIDARATPPVFFVYRGTYTENVVVPSSLAEFSLQGEQGAAVVGTFVVNMPAVANVAFSGIDFQSLTLDQPAPSAITSPVKFESCSVSGALIINSVHATGGATIRATDCEFNGSIAITGRTLRWVNCRGGASTTITTTSTLDLFYCVGFSVIGTFQGSRIELVATRMGTSGAHVWNFTAVTSTTFIWAGSVIRGRVNFAGSSCLMWGVVQEYNGSPAVADACTNTSFCQGNTFSHNAGPLGPVWMKTGPSLLFDGGNNFCEGQEYPFFGGTGGRQLRGQTDDRFREVISLPLAAGPVTVLTVAQVANWDLLVIGTVGGGMLQLPPILDLPKGARVTAKRRSGAAVSFGVQGTGLNFVDGAASIPILNPLGCLTFQSDGVDNWEIVGSYLVP
jgi:hypothetical protein